ncbi:hypothetical protein [Agromyces humi]|uniref:hypothetical protein n=1 Tax=Agromyces humi TaxID=1766800 RepID=UPI00135A978A|nr:hypothetical protein [Agromyces humi]
MRLELEFDRDKIDIRRFSQLFNSIICSVYADGDTAAGPYKVTSAEDIMVGTVTVPLDEQHTGPGIERLAASLHDHVYGAGEWEHAEPEARDNYLADAREIAQTHPHLLSLRERGID